MIKYGKHYVDKHDINEVKKALKSDFLTQGPFVEKFQKKILKFFGGKYCLAVSSGTAALHLAGLALGWKKNDIIIVSPLTFVASANSALYCGSKVIFSDINEKTLTLDVNKLEKKIQSLIKSKKKVNSVVVTDFGGYPADWVQPKKLSKKLKESFMTALILMVPTASRSRRTGGTSTWWPGNPTPSSTLIATPPRVL